MKKYGRAIKGITFLLCVFMISMLQMAKAQAGTPDTFTTKSFDPLPTGSMADVAYGNSVYVAVGSYGSIITSADANTWTNAKTKADSSSYIGVTDPTTFSFNGIAFGNGVFVAVGGNGVILTSANGTSWTQVTSGITDGMSDVEYLTFNGSSSFYAISTGKYLTSSNGSSWTPVVPTGIGASDFITEITVGNGGTRLALGASSGDIYHTTNGSSWTKVHPQTAVADGTAYASGINMLRWMNDRYVISDPSSWLWSSTDLSTFSLYGTPFKQRNDTSTIQMFNGFYAAGTYYLFGFGGTGVDYGAVYTSTNGTSWSLQTYKNYFVTQNSVYVNGKYFRLGNEGMQVASDGTNWSYCWGGSFNDATYDGSKYIAVGKLGAEGAIWSSSDLQTWSQGSISSRMKQFYASAYGNNQYVAIGEKDGTSATLATSSDGLSWTKRLTTNCDLYDVAYGNGVFIAVGTNNWSTPILQSSSNGGVSWTVADLSSLSMTSTVLSSIEYINGQFIVLGYDGSSDNCILTSTDGINWTDHSDLYPVVTDCLVNITYNAGQYILMGYNASTYEMFSRTSPDLDNWSAASVTTGSSYSYTMTSQLARLGNNIYAYFPFYNPVTFVSTYYIYYSSDQGTTWQNTGFDISAMSVNSVINVNGKALITGAGRLVMATEDPKDSTSTVTAASTVTEPVALSSTVISSASAVNVLDFKITDAGTSDGVTTDITQVKLSTSGTGDFSKVTWRLNGPDASNVVGTYSSGTNTITFSGLNISIADGGNETYTVNAYYNNNTGLTEGQTFILAVNGSSTTNFTVSNTGSTMANGQSAVNNGTGSTVDVVATKLIFTTQPGSSVSGVSMTQSVVKATDAADNVDAGYTGSITISESSAGALSGTVTKNAVAGVATFSGVIYTASADQETFALTASDGSLTNDVSSTVTSDVVATKLVFQTQPSPVSIISGQSTSFTTVPVVRAVDANGTVDTGYSTNMVLAITDPNDGTVDGTVNTISGTGDLDGSGTTVTLASTNGVATYTGLSLRYTSAGSSDTIALRITSGALTAAISSNISAATAPTIVSVTVPANGDYKAGVNLDFAVKFTEAVTLTDNAGSNKPYLSITLSSGGTVRAYYVSGSGTDTMTFRYTIIAGDNDADGIALASPISLNTSGTIKGGTSVDAGLSFTVPDTSHVYVDTSAPGAPVVTGISQDLGVSSTDGITNDQTLVINGTAEANSTVGVYKDGVFIGTVTASGAGSWTFDYTGTTLTAGSYIFTAKATDAAGNTGSASSGFTVVIDTTVPVTPVITSFADDTGASATDKITMDTTLILYGTAEADSYVQIKNNDTSATLGTAQADASGNWVFDYTATSLTSATYHFVAIASDAASNQSSASSIYTITIDASAPTGGSISINSGASYATSASVNLTLSATGASEMIISEYSDFHDASYVPYTTSKSFTLSSGDEAKTIYVKYKDVAGNETSSISSSIGLDTQAPSVLISSTATGPSSAATIPVTVTFSEAVTGFIVSDLSIGNGSAGNFSGSGTTYTFDLTPSSDGVITVDISGSVAQDAAATGNTSASRFSITSDRTAPTLSGLGSSNISYTSLSVSAAINEAGTIYYLVVPDGSAAPTHAQIKAGTNYGAVTIATHGSRTVSSSPYSYQFGLTGLSAGTAYDIYITAEDTAITPNTVSGVSKLDVTTQFIEITSMDAIMNVDAGFIGSPVYANVAAVQAALPTSIKANGTTVTIPVTSWLDTDTYNASTAGSFTFTAVLGSLPAGYANSGNYTATVEVVLRNHTYYVTYDLNGGTGTAPTDSKAYIQGENITLAAHSGFVKTHYSFQGWATAASGSAISATTYPMGNTDQTLYAIWNENLKFTLTYDVNSGSGSAPVDNTLYYEGDVVNVVSVTGGAITLLNHTLGGWSTTPNGGSVGSTFTMGNSNTTLYVVWVEDGKFTVTYDANGGSGVVPTDPNQYYQGATATILAGTGLTKVHYSFSGWGSHPTATAVTGSSITIGASNVTLYALWTENAKYTVTYDANGGSGTVPVDNTMYYSGDAVTLAANSLSKTSYTFGGWSLTPGGSVINGAVYMMGSTNVTLYAVWNSNPSPAPTGNPTSGGNTQTSGTTQETRTVNVNGVNDTSTNTVASVAIVRSVTEEKKVDAVVLDQGKTQEVIKKLVEEKQNLVQIVVDEVPGDQADEVAVTINKASVKDLSTNQLALEVKTEEVTIQIPQKTLETISESGEDLYFRIIPIRDEEKQTEVIQNALTAKVVQSEAGSSEVVALGTPMTIETNYKDMTTKVVFSLKGIEIPTDAAQREEFLKNLGVYINHSDGEQELARGTIKYDSNGTPIGIEIEINKFSTFTIVSIKNTAPVASKAKITGSAVAGKTLTITYQYKDADHDKQGKTIIIWYRADSKNGKNKKLISSGTKDTYQLTKKDQGKYIIVKITPAATTGILTGKAITKAIKIDAPVKDAVSEVVDKVTDTKAEIDYTSFVKLGLIKNKTYAEKVAAMFTKDYENVMTKLVKEGNYYRIYLDFVNKSTAQKICKDMKNKHMIINYYFYTK